MDHRKESQEAERPIRTLLKNPNMRGSNYTGGEWRPRGLEGVGSEGHWQGTRSSVVHKGERLPGSCAQ